MPGRETPDGGAGTRPPFGRVDDGAFGEFYRGQGFHVLIADARGHGMSGGNYIGFGYLEQPDYISWLKRMVDVVGKDARILLHGVTVLMLAGNKRLPTQVKAVDVASLEASFSPDTG